MFWNAPKMWQGEEAFIIGGGPSLKKMDLAPLHDKHVIGCNDAYKLGQWVDICIFGDYDWYYGPYGNEEGLAGFGGLKVTCTTNDRTVDSSILRLDRAHNQFSEAPKIGWFLSTGSSAVNLAVILGATTIYLLGFDMHLGEKGENNWHPNLKDSPRPNVFSRHIKGFKNMSEQMEKRCPGVIVYNLTPNSALTMFEKKVLEDVLCH